MSATEPARFVNPVKERLKAGEAVLGITVRMARSAEIARIAKTTGHDFLFIDVQHSIYNLETISHMAQTAMAIGIVPLVRARLSTPAALRRAASAPCAAATRILTTARFRSHKPCRNWTTVVSWSA